MTLFLDSHAHLGDPAFDEDREAAISRARQAGAIGITCIGESLAAARRAQLVSKAHPEFVRFTAGIHPHDAADFDPVRDGPAIADFLAGGAVAVGECGLDYHYDHSPPGLQRRAFAAQLALARDARKPVVVHTRNADADTASMIEEAGGAGVVGVLHCFTGTPELAETALTAGWYISFSGIVTFKRWADDAVVRLVPDEKILVESDAPYLAPVPHRGHRNEPAWITFTLGRLAIARGVDSATLGEQTAANAKRLFGW